MTGLRLAVRLMVPLVVLVLFDGCLYRDPYVSLGNGYGIGAISGGSPCALEYSPPRDSRSYSTWRAGTTSGRFWLNDTSSSQYVEYLTREEWDRARRDKNARPLKLPHREIPFVTGFTVEERYVAGKFQGGFFLLDKSRDEIETFPERGSWLNVVRAKTALDPDQLFNPKSRLLQTREAAGIAFEIVVTLPFLIWALQPMFWRGRSSPRPSADSGAADNQRLDRPNA